MKLKKALTNWKVILLLIFLVFSFITIKPQFGANDGVMIRNVVADSAAAQGGVENPAATLPPLSRERVISLNGDKITDLASYHGALDLIQVNQTVRVETDKRIYTLLALEDKDIGLKVVEAPSNNLRKGLDLAGGTRVLLKPEGYVSPEDFDLTIENLKERLNVYGLSDVVVRSASDLSGDDFILVEIAGVTEQEVKDLLASQGKFEAKISNETVFFGGKRDITHVCRTADCSGIDPNSGCFPAGEGYACNFFFAITLSPEAAKKHAEITGRLDVLTEGNNRYLSDDLYLYLDDAEVDVLRIGAELKGRETTQIQISGSGSGINSQDATRAALENMKRLQTIMITGGLPVKLNVVKMDTISPSLGQEFLNNILLVGLLVVAAVILVVFIRYRTLKIVIPIVLTMVAELVVILGFAAFVGWNLDLAAIAGIIIVAGTGVDHLIIITDETVKGEVSSNWKKRIKNAMFIVMGAYLTTLSGMFPLLWAGAGLLKGFALTTIAGVSFGVLLARPAFAIVIEKLLEE